MILLTYSLIVNQVQAFLPGLKFEVVNSNKKLLFLLQCRFHYLFNNKINYLFK